MGVVAVVGSERRLCSGSRVRTAGAVPVAWVGTSMHNGVGGETCFIDLSCITLRQSILDTCDSYVLTRYAHASDLLKLREFDYISIALLRLLLVFALLVLTPTSLTEAEGRTSHHDIILGILNATAIRLSKRGLSGTLRTGLRSVSVSVHYGHELPTLSK
jgi:hypothetical protein